MNAPTSTRRSTTAVVLRSLLWLWLTGLSVLLVLGYERLGHLADRTQTDSGLHLLETRVAALDRATKALQQQPAAATQAGLQDARKSLEARIETVEQSLEGRAAATGLQALRTELQQLEARQAAATAVPVMPRAPSRPTAAKSEPPPLPFRVVGAELRAGQRSVSVAPATGDFNASQIQVLLPGDAIGAWRVQAIEGNTAVFQSGKQVRRVAIP